MSSRASSGDDGLDCQRGLVVGRCLVGAFFAVAGCAAPFAFACVPGFGRAGFFFVAGFFRWSCSAGRHRDECLARWRRGLGHRRRQRDAISARPPVASAVLRPYDRPPRRVRYGAGCGYDNTAAMNSHHVRAAVTPPSCSLDALQACSLRRLLLRRACSVFLIRCSAGLPPSLKLRRTPKLAGWSGCYRRRKGKPICATNIRYNPETWFSSTARSRAAAASGRT